MSNNLAAKIAASNQAQGYGTQRGADEARDAYLKKQEEINNPPDQVTALEVMTKIEEIVADKPLAEAREIRSRGWGLVFNTEDFKNLNYGEQAEIKKLYDTKLNQRTQQAYDSLDPGDPANAHILKMYGQFNQMRAGEQVDINGWEAFGKALVENSTTGGLIFGAADMFSDSDLKETYIGTAAKEMEDLLIETAESFDYGEAQDYRRGRAYGTVLGLTADMGVLAATGSALGFAKAGTILGTKAAQAAIASGKTIKAAKAIKSIVTPLVINSLEGAVYVGEEYLNRFMNNEMEDNEDVDKFIKQIPGIFGAGVAMGLVGETLLKGVGHGMSRGRTAAIKTLETKGVIKDAAGRAKDKVQKTVVKSVVGETFSGSTIAEQKRYSRILLADMADETPWSVQRQADLRKKYLDLGWTEEGADEVVMLQKQAAFLKNPDQFVAEDALTKEAIRMQWNADFEETADGALKFSRLNGKALDQAVVVKNTAEDLQAFYQNNIEGQWNKHLEEVRAFRGFFSAPLEVSVASKGAELTTVKIDSGYMLRMARPHDGVTDSAYIEQFVKQFDLGADVKIKSVDHNTFYKNYVNESGVLQIPQHITSPKQSEAFVVRLFEQIGMESHALGRFSTIEVEDIIKMVLGTSNARYNKSFIKKLGHKASFVKDDKGFKIMLDGEVLRKGKAFRRFKTEKEAVNWTGKQLHMESLGGDIKGVQAELTHRGVRIEAKGGKLHTTINGDDYKVFDSIENLLEDSVTRPDIPYELRPAQFELSVMGDQKKVTYANSGDGDRGVSAAAQKLNKSKSIQELSQTMSEYSYVRPSTYKLKDPGVEGVEVFTNGITTTLRMPDTGFVKDFSSPALAKKYLADIQNQYGNVLKRADDIGMVIRPNKIGWTVGNDFKMRHFNSLSDAEKYLARDTWISAKELADPYATADATKIIDEAVSKSVLAKQLQLENISNAKMAKAQGKRESKWFKTARSLTEQTGTRIARSGDMEGSRVFKVVQDSFRKMDSENTMNFNMIHGTFKNFSDGDRHFMGMLLLRGDNPKGWADSVGELNKALGTEYKLTADKVAALMRTKDLFEQGGQMFGVSGDKWIKEYAPRLASIDPNDPLKKLAAQDVIEHTDKYKQLISENMSPQDVPFFLNARTSESGTFLMDTNIENMLQQYYNIGTRAKYMKEPIAQLTAYSKGIKGDRVKLDNLTQMKQVMDSITGRVDDTGSAMAAHNLNDIKRAKKEKLFGSDGPQKGDNTEDMFTKAIDENTSFEDVVKNLEGINAVKSGSRLFSAFQNGALMAWNLRMPIRNVSQVFTNLSPLVGIRYTNRAIHDVLKDKKTYERLYKEGVDTGIIAPVKANIRMRSFTDVAERNVTLGMSIFRKSDDLTRVVSMRANELRVADAIMKAKVDMKTGLFDPTKFLRDTSGDYLDDAGQKRLLDMVSGVNSPTGVMDERGIKVLMQREITTLSMYDYSAHLRPEKMRTQVGQIFGKMSTWPVSYFELVRRGVKARPVEFTANIIAAQAAIGFIYNDMLDLNGVPYTPVGNMTYMGGPGLEGIPNALGAATSAIGNVAKGEQSLVEAAGDIGKAARWTIPFYKQVKDASRAIDRIQNNEYREGMLHMLGANPDYNMPGAAGVLGINLEPNKDFSPASWWEAMNWRK